MNSKSSRARILLLVFLCVSFSIFAQEKPKRIWSAEAQPIVESIRRLRSLPDNERGAATKDLALKIRALPAGPDKTDLALGLASRATEGDFGKDNLQEVTTTLAGALKDDPQPPNKKGEPAEPYVELAELVRYEHMKAELEDPQYAAAMAKLEAQDKRVQDADFTLTDIKGKTWNLKSLKGKVVMVNFWATWCPPCRKEMPDLQTLTDQFGKKGLVILGITDEENGKVTDFLSHQHYNYPILFDPDRKAAEQFFINGIPKSFLFDRDGKLVAQTIDMRTLTQFRDMLALAGLK